MTTGNLKMLLAEKAQRYHLQSQRQVQLRRAHHQLSAESARAVGASHSSSVTKTTQQRADFTLKAIQARRNSDGRRQGTKIVAMYTSSGRVAEIATATHEGAVRPLMSGLMTATARDRSTGASRITVQRSCKGQTDQTKSGSAKTDFVHQWAVVPRSYMYCGVVLGADFVPELCAYQAVHTHGYKP